MALFFCAKYDIKSILELCLFTAKQQSIENKRKGEKNTLKNEKVNKMMKKLENHLNKKEFKILNKYLKNSSLLKTYYAITSIYFKSKIKVKYRVCTLTYFKNEALKNFKYMATIETWCRRLNVLCYLGFIEKKVHSKAINGKAKNISNNIKNELLKSKVYVNDFNYIYINKLNLKLLKTAKKRCDILKKYHITPNKMTMYILYNIDKKECNRVYCGESRSWETSKTKTIYDEILKAMNKLKDKETFTDDDILSLTDINKTKFKTMINGYRYILLDELKGFRYGRYRSEKKFKYIKEQ